MTRQYREWFFGKTMSGLEEGFMTRREILKWMVAVGVQSLVPLSLDDVQASIKKTGRRLGKLSLHNEHTGESLYVDYLSETGSLDRKVCHRLNGFFRCHYDGSIRPIDPRLFLFLDAVHCLLKARGKPFRLVSGYRSPAYNRMLCSEDPCVATNSYHVKGMAADVYMDGLAPRDIERAARRLKIGGVGIYSDFVHLDVGPVRTW